MKFSIKDFFSKCKQSADLATFTEKKSLMESFIFCEVLYTKILLLTHLGDKHLKDFSLVEGDKKRIFDFKLFKFGFSRCRKGSPN